MMRIQFERTGGFAGLKLSGIFDAETLSPAEVKQLSKMIESVQLLDWPESDGAKPMKGVDQFQYKLVVEAQSTRRTIIVSDENAPADLHELLDWLTDKARKAAIVRARETSSKEAKEAKDTKDTKSRK